MVVRVRFSVPASAGLSLIEARTALYSWLLARHEGGALVLSTADGIGGEGSGAPLVSYGQATCDELRWLGLDWDEGPALKSERVRGDVHRAQQIARSGTAAEAMLLEAVAGDHALGITHVVQVQEKESAGPTYRRLAEALGWIPPTFVDVPPLAPGGASARPASLRACREQGYLGLAVANDLARMGWTPRGKRQLLALNALAARFDVSRLAHGSVRPVPGQLDWFNRRCLNELDLTERVRLMAGWWEEAYGRADRAEGTELAPETWQRVLVETISSEVHALAEVPDKVRFAFVDPVDLDEEAAEILSRPYAPQVLSAFAESMSCLAPFTYEALDAAISALRWEFKEVLGIRSRDVLHVIRAALVGRADAPCVIAVCQLLGKERCMARAQQRVQQGRRTRRAWEQARQTRKQAQQTQRQAQQAREQAQQARERARQARGRAQQTRERVQQAQERARQAQEQVQQAEEQASRDADPAEEG